MRWKTGRRSSNIEDRRGRRLRGGTALKGGVGTIVLTLALAYFLGIDPQVLLQLQQGGGQAMVEADYQPTPLADTEDIRHAIFREAGRTYEELQADCFAGLWGNHADRSRQVLEQGDIEEALNAATAIGDDRLQQEAQGHVVPESFTHGMSRQRLEWFKRGIESGDFDSCNTFDS